MFEGNYAELLLGEGHGLKDSERIFSGVDVDLEIVDDVSEASFFDEIWVIGLDGIPNNAWVSAQTIKEEPVVLSQFKAQAGPLITLLEYKGVAVANGVLSANLNIRTPLLKSSHRQHKKVLPRLGIRVVSTDIVYGLPFSLANLITKQIFQLMNESIPLLGRIGTQGSHVIGPIRVTRKTPQPPSPVEDLAQI